MSNLAWCCPGCNLAKASRMDAVDPTTERRIRLFHPRRDDWAVHFEWLGYVLFGQTPKGRATVSALDLNHERRLRIRRAEEMLGLFPP